MEDVSVCLSVCLSVYLSVCRSLALSLSALLHGPLTRRYTNDLWFSVEPSTYLRPCPIPSVPGSLWLLYALSTYLSICRFSEVARHRTLDPRLAVAIVPHRSSADHQLSLVCSAMNRWRYVAFVAHSRRPAIGWSVSLSCSAISRLSGTHSKAAQVVITI